MIKATNDKDAEFADKDVLAFLGDFGIGNSMEHTDAIESATGRLNDLAKFKKKKVVLPLLRDKGKAVQWRAGN